jgi:hypothetical protein
MSTFICELHALFRALVVQRHHHALNKDEFWGVSVFLMSQSPDDYEQQDFDFTELLEFIFLLQSNAGATKFLQNAFGVSPQETKTLSAEVANLPTAEAIGKSYDAKAKDKVKRLRVRQFWRDKGKASNQTT